MTSLALARNKPLRTFVALLLLLTAVCAVAEAVCRYGLHLGDPYNWPLVPYWSHFADLYTFEDRFRKFHSVAFFYADQPIFNYPAPLAVVYKILFLFPHFTKGFLAAYLLTLTVAACLLARKLLLLKWPLASTLLLVGLGALVSYPVAFELQQANMEWVVWLFVMTGLWSFTARRPYLAAALFGIAGAMKILPLIFLGLLLSRRQYRQFAVGFVVAGVVSIACMWLLCPDISVASRGLEHGVAQFRQLFILRYERLEADHSLFALIKAALRAASAETPSPILIAHLLSIYLAIAALAGLLLYFFRIRTMPMINQVLCLTVAFILLPPISYDYTLLHLYAPLALLVLLAVQTPAAQGWGDMAPPPSLRGLMPAMICFAVLMAPEKEFIAAGVSYNGQIKALTLIVLLVIGLLYPFRSTLDAESSGDVLIA